MDDTPPSSYHDCSVPDPFWDWSGSDSADKPDPKIQKEAGYGSGSVFKPDPN